MAVMSYVLAVPFALNGLREDSRHEILVRLHVFFKTSGVKSQAPFDLIRDSLTLLRLVGDVIDLVF